MSFQRFRMQVEKKFPGILATESTDVVPNVIPTGSLALDYALGIGGWPRGAMVGVFGPRNVGKTVLALNACRNALEMKLNVAFISVEGWHTKDWEWARALGVDTSSDGWMVAEPEHGEEAFEFAIEAAKSGADLIVIDSLGAMVSKTELEGTGRVGGQSKLITEGSKLLNSACHKNNSAAILLNQVRDVIGASMPVKKQPGGNGVEHLERLIVELKNREKFLHPTEKDTVIGRAVVAIVQRTKFTEGDGQRAYYDFYSMHVAGKPFGIDRVTDVVTTGKRVGAIQGSTWLTLPDGSRHQGAKAAGEYVVDHPAVYEQIREAVLEQMVARGGKIELRVVEQ